MADSGHRKTRFRRGNKGFPLVFCCSSGVAPKSPEASSLFRPKTPQKLESFSKSFNSFPNSPQSIRSGLGLVGRIDPRRMLSPGRVSPIDSDHAADPVQEIETMPSLVDDVHIQLGSVVFQAETTENLPAAEGPVTSVASSDPSLSIVANGEGCSGIFDVRLSLKGKNGGSLVLEVDSGVLSSNSSLFAGLISDYRKGSSDSSANLCRIEVPDVENLSVFHETIKLMFEEDITTCLLKVGVSRSIDILEVAAGIQFSKGIFSCLKYLEAVPWSEDEEEKLKRFFARVKFDEATTRDVLARLYPVDSVDTEQNLAMQLLQLITNGRDNNARNELKSLVKGLLSKSSVYEKGLAGVKKEDLYVVCQACLGSLASLFEEASCSHPKEGLERKKRDKPLVEQISMEVDNINWILDILQDRQMAEEFVGMWADQSELIRLHGEASVMVRYELSRISAWVFMALGKGKLHCQLEARLRVLQAWFGPMLSDFGWLQRRRKGLDVKALEEAMGQALLTLPLKHQCMLFMDWFHWFSMKGTEAPNLSKAFQIWWRRSFLRGSEIHTIEPR